MSLWCIPHFDYFKVYYFVLNYSVFLALEKINLFYFLLFMHSIMLFDHFDVFILWPVSRHFSCIAANGQAGLICMSQ